MGIFRDLLRPIWMCPHHWEPLVLSALDATVFVPALVMWPAHLCGSVCSFCVGSISHVILVTCPFLCLSFHLLLSSVLRCLQPFLVLDVVSCLTVFCWVSRWCFPHHWPDRFRQRFHSWAEVKYGQKSTLRHFLSVSCVCFLGCCTECAQLPFSVMQIPT